MKTTAQTYKRDNYNAIIMSSVNVATRKQVNNLFDAVTKSEKVDEHGNWEFGAEFDRKGRGYAINYDYYAIGRDFFTKRLLMIVQVRKYEKRYKNGFGNIQKSYFLCGRNEDDTAFAHPVESRVIHHAISKGTDIIRVVQNWIFGGEYTSVIRQGDMCFLPMKKKPVSDTILGNKVILQGSHELLAVEIVTNGNNMYAKNPELWHLGGVHPVLFEEGWFKIVVGRRGNYHDFATPTID